MIQVTINESIIDKFDKIIEEDFAYLLEGVTINDKIMLLNYFNYFFLLKCLGQE